MENVTYAKIMGLARDEDGRPAFGYMKLEGVKLQKDTVAKLMHTTPDTVVMLTAEEYYREMDADQLEPGDTVQAVKAKKSESQKYDAFMQSMRKKLDRPPYSGNKGEAYREGIRAAMSKMHALYGEGVK